MIIYHMKLVLYPQIDFPEMMGKSTTEAQMFDG